jgi:hypothetical protein
MIDASILEPIHTVFPLSAKELTESLLFFLLGAGAGSKLIHKFIIVPMHKHHKEQMAAHQANHEEAMKHQRAIRKHLGIEEDPAS